MAQALQDSKQARRIDRLEQVQVVAASSTRPWPVTAMSNGACLLGMARSLAATW
jgi:hypothetical protein